MKKGLMSLATAGLLLSAGAAFSQNAGRTLRAAPPPPRARLNRSRRRAASGESARAAASVVKEASGAVSAAT